MFPRTPRRGRTRVALPLLLSLLLPAALLAPTGAVAAGVSLTSAVTESTPTRLAIDVAGEGYSREAPGIYVGLAPRGGASVVDANAYVGAVFVRPGQIGEGGRFSQTLELDAAEIAQLDATKQYAVYTFKAHGQAASDPSQNAEVPVDLDFSTLVEAEEPQEPTEPETPEEPEEPAEPETPAEPEAPAAPSVSVSGSEFSTVGAATVTVTGKNFDPALATGVRPPLAGRPAGAYVVFGKFADVWQPSKGAASSARVVGDQKWAVPADSMAALGAQAVELAPDGSFTAELTIDKAALDAKATSESLKNYGVYTYAGSGASVAAYETATPLTFVKPAPSVTVSRSEFSTEGAATVTVQGKDFDPSLATGVRPPLAGKPAGAYVVFGKFADVWQPSKGAASSTRVNSSQKWAVSAADTGAIGGAGGGAIELRPDGSFTAELTIDKAALDAKATSESLRNYGIYTYAGSGASVAAYETATPVTFVKPAPSVSVSRAEFSTVGAATVTVTGKNFDPSLATGVRPPLAGRPAGAYVVFGKFADVWQPSKGAASSARVVGDQKWAVPADSMAALGAQAVELAPDGSFTAELTIDKAALDAKATSESLKNYGVYTYAGSGASVAAYETATPLTFTAPGATSPTLDVEVVEQVEGRLTVDVEGSGYATTAPGVYLGISESGGASATDFGAYRGAVFVPSATMGVGGTFARTLTLDAAAIDTLDPTKQYSVYSLKAHGQAVSDPSQTVEKPIAVDFAAILPAPEPEGAQLEVEVVEQEEGSLKVAVEGSGYATTFPGVYVGISESGGASATDAGAYRGAIWVQAGSMGVGGTFERTIELDAAAIATLDPTEDYSVYSLRAHGMADPGLTQSVEKAVDLDVALLQGGSGPVDPEPSGPSLAVEVEEQKKGSLKVAVEGTGYAATSPGVYVAIAPVGGGSATDASAYVGTEWVQHTQMGAGGTFAVTLSPSAQEISALDPGKDYAVYSLKAHGQAASDPTQTVEVPIDLDVALLQDGVVVPPTTPTDPGTGPGGGGGGDTPTTSGSLRWGVKAAFRSYVTGPIAKGRVAVSSGASASGGSYRFFQRSTSASGDDARGSTRYGGTVRFTGHSGALDLAIADPTVTVRAGRVGTLSAVMAGRRIDVGSVDLARASRSTKGGAVTYAGAPVRLTAAGARAFQGFYSAGETMDPVTFTVGADGGAASGGGTVASAVSTSGFVPPTAPPASTGITLDLPEGEGVRPGGRLTASASGFQPGETDIAVVVYSTPVVLERSLTADAQGAATWSGVLPGDLEPGEHTLTFQGSVSRGVVFTVDEDEDAERCEVADASLTWGVKESFRSYVSGSIANGDWTTSGDASYETPEFGFAAGSGSFDAATTEGDVAFDGAIRFTGHSGALEVVLEDPVVRFTDADTAVLLLDVTAGDREAAEAGGDAAPTTTEDVPFVELDLAAADVERTDDGTGYTVTDAPAVLTEQGHGVFGTYEAGTAFDPLDLTVTTAADCAGTEEEASASSAGGPEAAGLVDASSDGGVPAWWVALAAALALVAGFGLSSLRRRSGGLR